MILTCPRDAMVLDIGEWDLLSINMKTGDSVYVWPRCVSSEGPPHWVSVRWRGKSPTVTTGPIVSVTPSISRMPYRGISPAPLAERPVTTASMPMVIRKR